MNDVDIIKALECCTSSTTSEACIGSPSSTTICTEMGNGLQIYALDLINRQKAEIERLQEYYKLYYERKKDIEELNTQIEHLTGNLKFVRGTVERQLDEIKRKDSQTEELVSFQRFCERKAIKEFAERLKQSAFDCDVSFGYGKEHYTEAVAVVEIDNLVKEMMEGKK